MYCCRKNVNGGRARTLAEYVSRQAVSFIITHCISFGYKEGLDVRANHGACK